MAAAFLLPESFVEVGTGRQVGRDKRFQRLGANEKKCDQKPWCRTGTRPRIENRRDFRQRKHRRKGKQKSEEPTLY
jgi:hypothetical protein